MNLEKSLMRTADWTTYLLTVNPVARTMASCACIDLCENAAMSNSFHPALNKSTWSDIGNEVKWGMSLAHCTSWNSCLLVAWQMLFTVVLLCNKRWVSRSREDRARAPPPTPPEPPAGRCILSVSPPRLSCRGASRPACSTSTPPPTCPCPSSSGAPPARPPASCPCSGIFGSGNTDTGSSASCRWCSSSPPGRRTTGPSAPSVWRSPCSLRSCNTPPISVTQLLRSCGSPRSCASLNLNCYYLSRDAGRVPLESRLLLTISKWRNERTIKFIFAN